MFLFWKGNINSNTGFVNKIRRIYNRIGIPLLINILLLFFLLILFTSAEKTDDFNEKTILSGAFSGIPSAHLLYSSYLYGVALKLLHTLFPYIAWYEVIQFVLIFISLTVVSVIAWDYGRKGFSLLILLPLLIYFGYDSYIKLTFSKTAGIVAATGFLLLFYELKKEKISKVLIAISWVLIFIGSQIRYTVFRAVVLSFAVLLLFELIILIRDKKNVLKNLLKYIILFSCAVILAVGYKQLDRRLYNINSQWAAYKEYNTYKAQLQDYGWPDYEENQEAYEELGISYNDYILWGKNRNYSDPDIYTLELMKKVCALKPNKSVYEKYVKGAISFFKEYPIKFFLSTGYIILLCMSAVLALSDKKNKYLSIAGSLLIPLLLEYYLYCNDRYGKAHIDLVVFYSAALILLHFLISANVEKKQLLSVFLVGIGLFVLNKDYQYISSKNYYGNSSFRVEQNTARIALDTISSRKGNLYVISYSEFTGTLRAYDTLEQVKTGSLDNLFILSAYAYPSHRAVLDKYGKYNIYKSLCDYNVYYVTSAGNSDIDTTLNYLKEHYYPNASYYQVEAFENVGVYKFYNYYYWY